MKWYIEVLKKYADFSGRARRKEYWMFVLFNMIVFYLLAMVVSFFTSFVPGELGGIIIVTFMIVYSLGMMIPSWAVAVRRLHDTDLSGWYMFISLIPIVGGIMLIVYLATDGSPGDNRYGRNPKEAEVLAEKTEVEPSIPQPPDVNKKTEKPDVNDQQYHETARTDEAFLKNIAMDSQNEKERRTAIIAIKNQNFLYDILINASAESENIGLDTLVALRKVSDSDMLIKIAKNAKDWSIRARACKCLEDAESLREISESDTNEFVLQAANAKLKILSERKSIDHIPSFESLFFQIGLFARGETTDGIYDPYSYESMSICDKFVSYGKEAAQVMKSYLMTCAAGREQYGWWKNSSLIVECIPKAAGSSEVDKLMLRAWLVQLVNVSSNIYEYDSNVRQYAKIELDALSD